MAVNQVTINTEGSLSGAIQDPLQAGLQDDLVIPDEPINFDRLVFLGDSLTDTGGTFELSSQLGIVNSTFVVVVCQASIDRWRFSRNL